MRVGVRGEDDSNRKETMGRIRTRAGDRKMVLSASKSTGEWFGSSRGSRHTGIIKKWNGLRVGANKSGLVKCRDGAEQGSQCLRRVRWREEGSRACLLEDKTDRSAFGARRHDVGLRKTGERSRHCDAAVYPDYLSLF